jgi:tetratricopeptide (TPR) repeat protein
MDLFTSSGAWDQYKYQDIIVKLSSLSLLQSVDIGSIESHFSLHPLVADWLKLRTDRKGRQNYTMETITILTEYINAKDLDTLPFQTKQDLVSHVDVCVRNEREYMEELNGSDVTSPREFAFIFALFYASQGRYKEAEDMYQRALAGYEKALGPEHTSTLDTVNNLGLLYRDQGKLAEAEAMYQRASSVNDAANPPHQPP